MREREREKEGTIFFWLGFAAEHFHQDAHQFEFRPQLLASGAWTLTNVQRIGLVGGRHLERREKLGRLCLKLPLGSGEQLITYVVAAALTPGTEASSPGAH